MIGRIPSVCREDVNIIFVGGRVGRELSRTSAIVGLGTYT